MRHLLPLLGLLLLPLSAQAQTTYFEVELSNVSPAYAFSASGAFNTPVGATEPAAIGPGGAYEIAFEAAPGSSLNFATMFVESNDLFYAPGEAGIALFDAEGNALGGDVTDQVMLWDAGTEVNQEPGVGDEQVMRQSAPNTGAAEGGTVRLVDDAFTYPAVTDVIQVTLTNQGGTAFTLRIENVSTAGTLVTSGGTELAVPLSPGVWVVHTDPAPLFSDGAADRGEGIEAIAEDGDPAMLAGILAASTGITAIFSPGVWAVHNTDAPLFSDGAVDRGEGLEAIAEDGDPSMLASALLGQPEITGGAFAVPVGSDAPGAIGPGGAYRFTVIATPGTMLTIASMFVQSNDLIIAPPTAGIALWDDAGQPISGDLTNSFLLWDVGTEVNEAPGVGPNQAPRQSAGNTGQSEALPIGLVNDGFSYPDLGSVVQVTITELAATPFVLRIENVSSEGTLVTSGGTPLAVPLSPGTWAVHSNMSPFFSMGAPDRGEGIEAIAEDGDPSMHGAALAARLGYLSGVFNTPVGATEPAAIGPGGAYEIAFEAAPGSSLSFTTMFVESNDLFYAPGEAGIALFDADGNALGGDVTDQVMLWDAGTEVNQEPGVGDEQVMRQSAPNTGAAEGGTVRLVDDAFTYPAPNDVLIVTLAANTTALEPAPKQTLPEGFVLAQNYPNPFNPETVVPFTLGAAQAVRLTVYNVLGQQVALLVDQQLPAGSHQYRWTATRADGGALPSGLYLYRLQVGDQSLTRVMTLLR